MLKRAKEKAEKAAKAAADAAAYAADQASNAAAEVGGMAGLGEDASPFDVAPSADDGPSIAEQLATLTADDDNKPDEQLMAAMVDLAVSGQPHEQSDLVGAIAERLGSPSATVQNKLLKTTQLLAERGTPEFGERLRHEAADRLRASAAFECPPHPQYGDKQQLMVRSTASNVMRALGLEAPPEPELQPEPEPEPAAAAAPAAYEPGERVIPDGLPPIGCSFGGELAEDIAGKEIKLILLGDSGTGKSNLMSRLAEDRFEPNHTPTVGMDHKKLTLTTWNRTMRLQVWDMAGKCTYGAILKAYYKKAAGGIIVYDSTDAASFENVGKWVAELQENTSDGIACILVATKCGDDARVVLSLDGQNAALQHGCSAHVETCAHDGRGVQEAFRSAAFAAYETLMPEEAQRARAAAGEPVAQEEEEPAVADEDGDFMSVVCPDGMAAGSLIVVETPDGREVEAEIPEGTEPGDEFEVYIGIDDDEAVEEEEEALAAAEDDPEEVEVDIGTPRSTVSNGGDATPRDSTRMEVECPTGVSAGQMILLTAPDGRDVEIEVPEGIGPGDTFEAFVGNTEEEAASPGADESFTEEETPRDCTRMAVECPEGVEAGQMIVLTTADGRDVEIEVPEGISAGDTFEAFVGNAEDGEEEDAAAAAAAEAEAAAAEAEAAAGIAAIEEEEAARIAAEEEEARAAAELAEQERIAAEAVADAEAAEVARVAAADEEATRVAAEQAEQERVAAEEAAAAAKAQQEAEAVAAAEAEAVAAAEAEVVAAVAAEVEAQAAAEAQATAEARPAAEAAAAAAEAETAAEAEAIAEQERLDAEALAAAEAEEEEPAVADEDGDFMSVVCPDGMAAGSLIVVETPDGREVEAEIPEGTEPGDEFEVYIGIDDDDDEAEAVEEEEEALAAAEGQVVADSSDSQKAEEMAELEAMIAVAAGEQAAATAPVPLIEAAADAAAAEAVRIASEQESAEVARAAGAAEAQTTAEVAAAAEAAAAAQAKATAEAAAAAQAKTTAEAADEQERLDAEAEAEALAAVTEQAAATVAQEEEPAAPDEDDDFMSVVCPDGMAAGGLIVVETPDGREVEAEIPEGTEPGDEFEVYIGIDDDDDEAEAVDAEAPAEEAAVDSSAADHMIVECPEGLGPGEFIIVDTPDGRELEITIPEGTAPGGEFEIYIGKEEAQGDAAAGSLEVVAMVDALTVDSIDPPDSEQLQKLCKLALKADATGTEELSSLLVARFEIDSATVKLKVLRVLMVIVEKVPAVKEVWTAKYLYLVQAATSYECASDPEYGDKPQMRVRGAAQKLMAIIAGVDAALAEARAAAEAQAVAMAEAQDIAAAAAEAEAAAAAFVAAHEEDEFAPPAQKEEELDDLEAMLMGAFSDDPAAVAAREAKESAELEVAAAERERLKEERLAEDARKAEDKERLGAEAEAAKVAVAAEAVRVAEEEEAARVAAVEAAEAAKLAAEEEAARLAAEDEAARVAAEEEAARVVREEAEAAAAAEVEKRANDAEYKAQMEAEEEAQRVAKEKAVAVAAAAEEAKAFEKAERKRIAMEEAEAERLALEQAAAEKAAAKQAKRDAEKAAREKLEAEKEAKKVAAAEKKAAAMEQIAAEKLAAQLKRKEEVAEQEAKKVARRKQEMAKRGAAKEKEKADRLQKKGADKKRQEARNAALAEEAAAREEEKEKRKTERLARAAEARAKEDATVAEEKEKREARRERMLAKKAAEGAAVAAAKEAKELSQLTPQKGLAPGVTPTDVSSRLFSAGKKQNEDRDARVAQDVKRKKKVASRNGAVSSSQQNEAGARMHQWAVEKEQRLKDKRIALEEKEQTALRAKSVKTAARVDINSFAARQDEHVKQKRENFSEKRAARAKKEMEGMFQPAITEKSKQIIAERTADNGGETSMQRLTDPEQGWSKRKAHVKGRKPMPVYKGFSKLPIRDWDGVDQWTGDDRAPPRRPPPGRKGSTSSRPRTRTPPRAKTPGGRPKSAPVANAAEKAALKAAAAAHDAAREELEAALMRVQMLSDAATTQRSDLDLAAAAAVGEGLDTARELVAQSEETTAALGALS